MEKTLSLTAAVAAVAFSVIVAGFSSRDVSVDPEVSFSVASSLSVGPASAAGVSSLCAVSAMLNSGSKPMGHC
jgi:hypothetical protein